MASLQAHIAAAFVRATVRRRLGDMDDVFHVRKVFESPVALPPRGVRFRPDSFSGVAGEWAEGTGPARHTMFYLHGGGFVACSPRTHRPITGWFANHGFRVFAPDYRLAPAHRFPAAIEDTIASWRAFRAAIDGPVVVAGDSAGGNLALTLLLTLRDDGDVGAPCAAALFSPLTDLTGSGASWRDNLKRDAMFGEGIANVRRIYLGGHDPADPRVSPLFANLIGLPPLLLHVGERELLRDDSSSLAQRARAADVAVSLEIFPVVPHVWQFGHTTLPEARRSLMAAADFLRRAADKEGRP